MNAFAGNPYLQEDAAGYSIEQVQQFIADGRAATAAALDATSALLDASRARAIAGALRENLARPGVFFVAALERRRRLQADTTTRPELIRQQWDDYGAEVSSSIADVQKAIETGVAELEVALEQEAIPASTDPAAVLVARQEVQAALALTPTTDPRQPFAVMSELAGRGGDIAAAVASEWGRLALIAAQGSDFGFDVVRREAVATALLGPDEGKRRAAAAWQATQKPRPGETIPSLAEAQTLASFVAMVTTSTVQTQIVLG